MHRRTSPSSLSALIATGIVMSTTGSTLGAPPVVLLDPSPDPFGSIGSSAVLTPSWMIVGAREKRYFAPDRTLHSYGALVLWPRAADGTPSDPPLTLWPQSPIRGARFGESLDLDLAAKRLLVGEPGFKTSPTAPRARGRAQVVDLSLATPAATELLVPPVTEGGLEFGTAVALDGSTVVVTAPGFTPTGATGDFGVAYRFERSVSESGVTWTLLHTILPPEGSPAYLGFGASVALVANDILVAAPAALNLPTHEHGRIYVYSRTDGTYLTTLTAPTPTLGDRFGAVMADAGDLVAVSAPGDECGLGEVHLFRHTRRGWTHEATLTAPGLDVEGWTGFGNSLSIDRERVMVGTGGIATGDLFGTKAAIFRRSGPPSQASWVLETEIACDPSGPTGSPVALDPSGVFASEASIDFGHVRYQALERSADLDFDGAIGAGDLAIFLGSWNAMPGASVGSPADLNGDGTVDQSDLAILLGAWG